MPSSFLPQGPRSQAHQELSPSSFHFTSIRSLEQCTNPTSTESATVMISQTPLTSNIPHHTSHHTRSEPAALQNLEIQNPWQTLATVNGHPASKKKGAKIQKLNSNSRRSSGIRKEMKRERKENQKQYKGRRRRRKRRK